LRIILVFATQLILVNILKTAREQTSRISKKALLAIAENNATGIKFSSRFKLFSDTFTSFSQQFVQWGFEKVIEVLR
jgi:hypothetical protein